MTSTLKAQSESPNLAGESGAAFQQACMCWVLDARLRAECSTSGQLLQERFGITETEAQWLFDSGRPALERYADGLLQKRWGETRRLFPYSLRLAPQLKATYQMWLASHPCEGAQALLLSAGGREALRALEALRSSLRRDRLSPDYAADLLGFEVLARCSEQDRQRRHLETRYAVHEWWQELRHGILPLDPEIRRMRYEFDGGLRWKPL